VIWALVHSSANGNAEVMKVLVEGKIVPMLMNIAKKHPTDVQKLSACFRIIGNLVSGDDEQTQKVLNNDIVPVLSKFVMFNHSNIRKEVCWIFSNILAGTESQRKLVWQKPKEGDSVLDQLVSLALTEESTSVIKELAWCFRTASEGRDIKIELFRPEKLVPVLSKFATKHAHDNSNVGVLALCQLLCHRHKDRLFHDKEMIKMLTKSGKVVVSRLLNDMKSEQDAICNELDAFDLPTDLNYVIASYVRSLA